MIYIFSYYFIWLTFGDQWLFQSLQIHTTRASIDVWWSMTVPVLTDTYHSCFDWRLLINDCSSPCRYIPLMLRSTFGDQWLFQSLQIHTTRASIDVWWSMTVPVLTDTYHSCFDRRLVINDCSSPYRYIPLVLRSTFADQWLFQSLQIHTTRASIDVCWSMTVPVLTDTYHSCFDWRLVINDCSSPCRYIPLVLRSTFADQWLFQSLQIHTTHASIQLLTESYKLVP